ncbi:MAG: endonuclease/exonuclease/phosphatase family protein [Desulfobacterales bacterium]|jgi:endonuclease/exonuclease/phosphatase family metal-dependent hydrolase
MKRLFGFALAGLLLLGVFSAPAMAGGDTIRVMTRNQYLGADLTPVITAGTDDEFITAANVAFAQIAANNFRLRARRLATEVALTKPDVLVLQEVFDFKLNGSNADPPSPFLDHLTETLNALDAIGQNYVEAARVVNFDLQDIEITLDTDGDGFPDTPGLVSVTDRDVILVREGIAVTDLTGYFNTGGLCGVPVPTPDSASPPFPPTLTSTVSRHGCNYTAAVEFESDLLGPITIPRGFVGVDVTVRGEIYRVVDTHLEVREVPPGNTNSRILQSLQAVELMGTLAATTPSNRKLIVAGDFNSSDEDVSVGGIIPPYQIITGTFIPGISFEDIWDTNPLKIFDPNGWTCCQLDDLSNIRSELDERIDIIFVRDSNFLPLAYVTGRIPIFPLWFPPNWASDHGGVFSNLIFR